MSLKELELEIARVYFDPMLRAGLEQSINNSLRYSKCSVFIQESGRENNNGVSLVINLDVEKVDEISRHIRIIKKSKEILQELGHDYEEYF